MKPLTLIRGILTSVTAAAGKILRFDATGRTGETIEDRELFQQYGVQSRPPAGSEAVILKQGENIIVVASENRSYRISLNDGEMAIYTKYGDKIHLKSDRKIEISAASTVSVSAPSVELGSGSGHKKLVTEDILTMLNGHIHLDPVSGYVGPALSASQVPNPFTTLLHATSKTEAL